MNVVKAIFGTLFTGASLALFAAAFLGEADGEISRLRNNDAPTMLVIAFGLFFVGIVCFATMQGRKASPSVGIGSFVMVCSNDGQKHPARIEQVATGHYLVILGNGQQHWVPAGVVTAT